MPQTLALDIGATKTRIAVISGIKIKDKKVIKTPKTKAEITKALFNLIDSYRGIKKIGIGVAAFTRNGRTYGTPNMDYTGVDIKSILKNRYKIPVFVDNDANCAGLAELYYGAGKGKKNFILLTLGTGIGGAIIINGKIYRGTGFAGEPGHSLVRGKYFEHIASAPASVKLGQKLLKRKITSEEIEKLADKGDKKAKKIYEIIGEYIGESLVNIAMYLDPEIIILGGGFAKVKHIYPSMLKTFKQKDIVPRKIPIVHAKLSDDAGLIGAALLPKETI